MIPDGFRTKGQQSDNPLEDIDLDHFNMSNDTAYTRR